MFLLRNNSSLLSTSYYATGRRSAAAEMRRGKDYPCRGASPFRHVVHSLFLYDLSDFGRAASRDGCSGSFFPNTDGQIRNTVKMRPQTIDG